MGYIKDLQDKRANILLKRIQVNTSKPSFVRNEYEQLKHLKANAYPKKYKGIRERELARIGSSVLLSNQEKEREGRILAELLEI